jgi:HlyD family secretion protein
LSFGLTDCQGYGERLASGRLHGHGANKTGSHAVKRFLGIVTALILVGGVLGALAMKYRPGERGEGEIVRLDRAARGDLVEVVSAPGVIEPKTKVSISARVAARLIELPFKEGDRVTRGDPSANPPVAASVLIRLDSRDLEAQLRAAEARRSAQAAQMLVSETRIASQQAQVNARKAELDDAERDLARQEQLFESRDVSQSVVEAAHTRVDQLRAQVAAARETLEGERKNLLVQRHEVEAAEAEIARARDSLSYTTITSPIDGVITKINSEVGELVVVGTMNNQGTVILEVADLDTMIVNARVDEASVSQVSMGQRAKVRSQAYKGEVFDGVVTAVPLAVTEEQRENLKYYKTEVTLETAGRRILSGLTADVDIETRRHEDVLRVPSQAVLGRAIDDLPADLRERPEVDARRALVTVVYRFVDGKALATPVQIGASDITHTVIESGLSEGDVVIAGPYKVLEQLKHDQKVRDETATTRPATRAAT